MLTYIVLNCVHNGGVCMHAVDDQATLEFICNNSAAPYFSNLAWFIGNHVIELDECLISQAQ